MRPHLACFVLLAVAVLGCESIETSINEVTDKHRAAIERNLAAWPAIAGQLRSLAPLRKSGLEGEHSFIVDALARRGEMPTAALCYAEDLETFDELGYVWGRLEDTGALNQCASLLHRRHAAFDPASPAAPLKGISLAESERQYPKCAGYRYLFVIRTLEFLEPSPSRPAKEPFVPIANALDLDTVSPVAATAVPSKNRARGKGVTFAEGPVTAPAGSTKELLKPEGATDSGHVTRHLFEGGYLRGEILVFELPSAALLGGFRFAAQSGVVVAGKDAEIASDLRRRVATAIRAALEGHDASAVPLGGDKQ